MESYAYTLLNNIGKVFKLPHHKSAEYSQLHSQLFQLLNRLGSNQINRQQAAESLSKIISQLQRLPPREGRTDERISVILEMLNPKNFQPTTVLDVGAGTSDITLALKNYYNLPTANVFAIDQKLPKVVDITPLVYVDGKIPLPDNSIDLIIMFVVLHHIPPDVRPTIISEVARVLSPKGVFIIREHDSDGTPEFYYFLDMIHIFWYLAYNETPDPLYLMSRTETQQLLMKFGLQPSLYTSYQHSNPQRLYHELYTKNPPSLPYQFADISAQITLQNFIDKIRMAPHTYESFVTLVPTSLQPSLLAKYNNAIQTNIDTVWSDINKEVALTIILKAVTYSSIHNGAYHITSAAINKAINEL